MDPLVPASMQTFLNVFDVNLDSGIAAADAEQIVTDALWSYCRLRKDACAPYVPHLASKVEEQGEIRRHSPPDSGTCSWDTSRFWRTARGLPSAAGLTPILDCSKQS